MSISHLPLVGSECSFFPVRPTAAAHDFWAQPSAFTLHQAGRYADYLHQRKAMMQEWADHLDQLRVVNSSAINHVQIQAELRSG